MWGELVVSRVEADGGELVFDSRSQRGEFGVAGTLADAGPDDTDLRHGGKHTQPADRTVEGVDAGAGDGCFESSLDLGDAAGIGVIKKCERAVGLGWICQPEAGAAVEECLCVGDRLSKRCREVDAEETAHTAR